MALVRSQSPALKDPETVMVSAYRSLGALEGSVNPSPVNNVSQISMNDQNAIYNLMGTTLPTKLGMHMNDAPSVQGWAIHTDTFWKNGAQMSARLKASLEVAAMVAGRTAPADVFNRVIGANRNTSFNSATILQNNDSISALASVVLAPEFQLT
jgi:uncharacterized protein (DUF1800 family)